VGQWGGMAGILLGLQDRVGTAGSRSFLESLERKKEKSGLEIPIIRPASSPIKPSNSF